MATPYDMVTIFNNWSSIYIAFMSIVNQTILDLLSYFQIEFYKYLG